MTQLDDLTGKRERLVYTQYENVLEDHVAELVHDRVLKEKWTYGFMSNRNEKNKHWNLHCGNNREEVIENGYDYVLPIFDAAVNKFGLGARYNISGFLRVYMNAHTFGITPHWHRDDGDFTVLYYPRMDWQVEWGGGTIVFGEEEDNTRPFDPKHGLLPTRIDKVSQYIGNSFIIFDAWRWHSAAPVQRECYELRPIIVFKCICEGVSSERLDFYDNEKPQDKDQRRSADIWKSEDIPKPKEGGRTQSEPLGQPDHNWRRAQQLNFLTEDDIIEVEEDN